MHGRARRLRRRLQTRRAPDGEPKRNPEDVRHLAHHQRIAEETGDKEGDQPGGDPRQRDVAGLPERLPRTSAGASENPNEEPKAERPSSAPKRRKSLWGFMRPCHSARSSGEANSPARRKDQSRPTPNSGRVPMTCNRRESARHVDQRLSRHLSREIATDHPGVTEDHDHERETANIRMPRIAAVFWRITVKTRTTSPMRVAAMTERDPVR